MVLRLSPPWQADDLNHQYDAANHLPVRRRFGTEPERMDNRQAAPYVGK